MFKGIKWKILNIILKIPINNNFIKNIEKFIYFYKGQGWEFNTINNEVNSCITLLKREPNIFIDIGANKGLYTKKVLENTSNNTEFYLFEPSSYNYKYLKKLFPESKFIINNVALSKNKEKKSLYSDKKGSGLSSLTQRKLNHHNIELNQIEEVEVIRFDQYWVNKDKIIDYVKIDVEGHELDVLEGFGDLIHKTKLIQFEFGGCNIDTKTYFQDFWYFFIDKNFLLYRITPRGPKLIDSYSEALECFLTTKLEIN